MALQRIGDGATPIPKLLILHAANDELVPSNQSLELEKICQDLQMNVKRQVVSNALHNEVIAKPQGRKEVVGFLQSFG